LREGREVRGGGRFIEAAVLMRGPGRWVVLVRRVSWRLAEMRQTTYFCHADAC
jgi:hypothetical protein